MGKNTEIKKSEKTFFQLMIADQEVDKTILRKFDNDLVALKTWLPKIVNHGTRGTFREFIDSSREGLKAMLDQKRETLKVLNKLEAQWQSQNKKPVDCATEPKSTSEAKKNSSAPDVKGQEKKASLH